MIFLVDASLPGTTVALLKSSDHDATDVRDLGLGAASDDVIASYAQSHGMVLISRDFDFADIRNYPPDKYAGIVVIDLSSTALASSILTAIAALLREQSLLDNLRVRLAIVSPGHIRLRPKLDG